MKKRTLIILLLVALISGGSTHYYLNSFAEDTEAPQPQETGQKSNPMNVTLLDLDGVPHNMSKWRGNIVVLNFWATWCPPCRREIPTLISLQDELEDQGVQFVGIAVDSTKRVAAYATEHNINYPILQGEGAGLDLSVALGNKQSILPYTVILNRSGEIIDRHTGEETREQLLAQINPMLQ